MEKAEVLKKIQDSRTKVQGKKDQGIERLMRIHYRKDAMLRVSV